MKKQIQLLFIALGLFTQINAQTELWGMTSTGGVSDVGTIYKTDNSGNNQVVEYSFSLGTGGVPNGSLLQLSDGLFYGMTRLGGANSLGVLFQYDPAVNIYTKKFDFAGTSNGGNPYGSLVEGSDGLLYGMTWKGGINDVGVIFQYDPASSTYTKIHDFDCTSGCGPRGKLVQGADGNLYGLTGTGGANGEGVLFQFNPNTNVYTKKIDFVAASSGSFTWSSLMLASDGMLYGTGRLGGLNGSGTLFQYDPISNIFIKKIDFNSVINGKQPFGVLTEASDGKLYGMTYRGGINDLGVIFQYNPITSNCITVIDFDGPIKGSRPQGSLMQASDGLLYGMTYFGGVNDLGVIFQYNPITTSYTKKLNFDGANGKYPQHTYLIETFPPCSSTTNTITPTACNTYTVPSGDETYTVSGTYMDTIPNVGGCDSVLTINLTINNSTSGSENVTACESYTWSANTTTYTTSGSYTAILVNSAGCDSTATLNLAINNSTSGSENVTACDSYTWSANTTTYATSGSYTVTLTNSVGCDSTATLNLTINNSNTGTDVITACDSHTWIDGNTYTTSNSIATHILTNMSGCDSVVTLDLTINPLPTVTTSSDTLICTGKSTTLTASGASTYNWDNGAGTGTTVSVSPTSTTTYTVTGTDVNGCENTASTTVTVDPCLGVEETANELGINIYPNPSTGEFTIDVQTNCEVEIVNVIGEIVLKQNLSSGANAINISTNPNGIYFINFKTNEHSFSKRVVLNK